jgi:flagellar basal body rod protein FlgF
MFARWRMPCEELEATGSLQHSYAWLQEYLQRRKEELLKMQGELEEARSRVDSHDHAVRVRASNLEVLASQMESAEAELRREREEARNEALDIKVQLAEVEENRRLANQVHH